MTSTWLKVDSSIRWSFVDMVASLEKIYDIEIDFEEGLNSGELTTVSGLTRAFMKKR